MLKTVIDANVFISGLLTKGPPRQLIEHLELDSYQLFYPSRLFAELRNTQTHPKLASRISPKRLFELIDLIESKGMLVEFRDIPNISRDPTDDDYLECARISACDFIATGDKDLLSLGNYASIQIIRPAQFLQILELS